MKDCESLTATGTLTACRCCSTSSSSCDSSSVGSLTAIGGQGVGVELDRVGAGLFRLLCEAHPAACCGAVEAGEDRNLHRVLAAPEVLEIDLVASCGSR